MTKINLDELIADREAGTDGPWPINNYNCIADAGDVAHAKERGRAISVGDILWSLPRSIGPINIDHNHWAGYYLTVSESDARRIARLPDLEAAYIEAVELLKNAMSIVENCTIEDGVCCCGDDMNRHSDPMSFGHSPIDHGSYVASQFHDAARAFLGRNT